MPASGYLPKKEKAFTISRVKFSDNYLFDEYHYDTGAPYGTVYPFKEIEKAPEFGNAKEKLAWLNQKSKELQKQSLELLWDRNENVQRMYKDKVKYLKECE